MAKIKNPKPNDYFTNLSIVRDYQWEGVAFLAKRNHAILNDDTGLGKTLQAIVAFSYYKHRFPEAKAIVLTEKSVVHQVANEFTWLTPSISVAVVTAESHPPDFREQAFLTHRCDVLVTTYSMVYKHLGCIAGGVGKGYVLICDEPNIFKNTNTVLHKRMRLLAKYASRVHGLTAMITENKLEDAYGVMKVISPDLFPTKDWFFKQYCKFWSPPGRKYTRLVTGYKNLADFRARTAGTILRRRYEDVELQLPEVIEQNIVVTLSREQSILVADAIKNMVQMPDGSTRLVEIMPGLIAQQQLANDPRILHHDIKSAKLQALYEILDGPLKNEKVLLTSKFKDQIDLIEEDLVQLKWPVCRITGDESAHAREVSKELFQKSNDPIILLATKAAAKGLNLQSGRILIHFDLPWGYGTYKQFIGRLKRIGSVHQSILVYRIKARLNSDVVVDYGFDTDETIDHHIATVLKKKEKLFLQASGDEEIDNEDDDTAKQVFAAVKRSAKGAKKLGGTNEVTL